MEKQYIKDRWGERELVIGFNGKDIVGIGEVISKNTERFIHIKTEDFIRIAKIIIEEKDLKNGNV